MHLRAVLLELSRLFPGGVTGRSCSQALAGRGLCCPPLPHGVPPCSWEMEFVAGEKGSRPPILFQLQDWVGMWSFPLANDILRISLLSNYSWFRHLEAREQVWKETSHQVSVIKGTGPLFKDWKGDLAKGNLA